MQISPQGAVGRGLVSAVTTDAHEVRPAAPLTLTGGQSTDQTAPAIASGEEQPPELIAHAPSPSPFRYEPPCQTS
jgi:hypothetical protein